MCFKNYTSLRLAHTLLKERKKKKRKKRKKKANSQWAMLKNQKETE
jgi:hypothetical protein